MDVFALQAFLSVGKHKSFSGAAAELHLTQPAVSKRVAALEAELETTLFDRIGRQVTFTEAGRVLQPYALQALADMQAGRIAVQNLSSAIGGKIPLGVSQHIALHRLPPILKKFRKEYPQAGLDIHFLESEEACLAVEQGKDEIALASLPLTVPDTLIAETVWLDTLLIVVARDHALARMRKVTAKDLQTHPAILPARGTFTRELVEKQVTRSGIALACGMETNNFETIRMMVAVGLGWTALPQTMVDSSLKVLAIPGLQLERRLGYVVHARRTLSNAAAAFIAMLKRTA